MHYQMIICIFKFFPIEYTDSFLEMYIKIQYNNISSMANFGDDYFKDVTGTITDADRIKAGYKLKPVVDNSKLQPKTLDSSVLRGDLSGVAIPVPINFHEGGMFNDAADRVSFSKPMGMSETSSIVPIDGQTITNPTSEQIVAPSNSEQTIIVPKSEEQLIGHSSNNPFRNDVLVEAQGLHKRVNIGEHQLIVGRGPNNAFGRPGFYAGLFSGKSFGSYPQMPIKYDACNVCDVDDNGKYFDPVAEHKQLQQPSNLLIDAFEQPLLDTPEITVSSAEKVVKTDVLPEQETLSPEKNLPPTPPSTPNDPESQEKQQTVDPMDENSGSTDQTTAVLRHLEETVSQLQTIINTQGTVINELNEKIQTANTCQSVPIHLIVCMYISLMLSVISVYIAI
jgi:hypothetical protein